uniref:Uncharacterized protein n=1 Tax=Globodera pallida TaxID=36090 RepID=A0A183CNL9_GLOPA
MNMNMQFTNTNSNRGMTYSRGRGTVQCSFDSNRGGAASRGGRGGGYTQSSDSTRGRGSNGGRDGTNSVAYGVPTDHSFATRSSYSRNNNVGGRGGVATSFGQPLPDHSSTNRWNTASSNWAVAYAAEAYASAARRVPTRAGSAERHDASAWDVTNSGWGNEEEEFANSDWGNNSNRGVTSSGLNTGDHTAGQTAWGNDNSWDHVAFPEAANNGGSSDQAGWNEQDQGVRIVPATPPIPTEGNASVEQERQPSLAVLSPMPSVPNVEERLAIAERESALLRTACDELRTQHESLRLEHVTLRTEHDQLKSAFGDLRATLTVFLEQNRGAANTALERMGQPSH